VPWCEIVVARPGEYLDDAAEIWAEATAARDGDPEVAPLEVARPLIDRVVNSSADSLLLIAVGDGRDPLGFAAAEPVGRQHEHCAELRYLGVRPQAWGAGVAGQLLGVLRNELRSRGFVEAPLWVYCDNRPAVDLYRRKGWQRSPDVRVHPHSGRREQRYSLPLTPRE
jgi:GNAT superfamily N-acetyltransferase